MVTLCNCFCRVVIHQCYLYHATSVYFLSTKLTSHSQLYTRTLPSTTPASRGLVSSKLVAEQHTGVVKVSVGSIPTGVLLFWGKKFQDLYTSPIGLIILLVELQEPHVSIAKEACGQKWCATTLLFIYMKR